MGSVFLFSPSFFTFFPFYVESLDNFVSFGNHVFVKNIVHGGGKFVYVYIYMEGGGSANQPVN